MMRLLGCFKQIPDIEQLTEEEWEETARAGALDAAYIKSVISCYDESGLELMLRFRDQLGEGADCELAAVTISDKKANATLKKLRALGFSRVQRIEAEAGFGTPAEHTAAVLTAYIRSIGGADLIVMGTQSADANNRKTPLIVCEQLGIPCLTNVIAFAPSGTSACRVTYRTDGEEIRETLPFPLVLAVGEASETYLRIPTLKKMVQAGRQPFDILPETALSPGEIPAGAELRAIRPVDQRRKGTVISGDHPEEIAKKLYQDYIRNCHGIS